MNILLVFPDTASGGVASVVRNLTEYLRSRGSTVRMLQSGRSILLRDKASKLGFPVQELRLQSPFGDRNPVISLAALAALFPIGLLQLIFFIRSSQIKVVNIHYLKQHLFYFALCRQILDFRLVCSIHGSDMFRRGLRSAKYPLGLRMLLRSSDWIVTPSADARRSVVEAFPKYASKTVFVHNGIDVDQIRRVRLQTKNSGPGRYILSVSACKAQKALDVLIRAMRDVARMNPGVRLLIVGDGPLREELEALAKGVGLSDRIEFLGQQSHEEVVELLRGCEVFVLPSRFETFGIAVLEAMVLGRPVVVTKVGGMPEIVRDGWNGFVVEPEDPSALAGALIELLGDAELRRRFGEAGSVHVQRHFNRDSMGAAYERLFRTPSGPREEFLGGRVFPSENPQESVSRGTDWAK